jgi:hypothetical protein
VTAVWMRLRSELRSDWRAWLGLALLIALAGGVALAAVAGARRTSSAYPRLVAWSRAPDLETGEFPDGVDAVAEMRTIVRLPSVLAWARVDTVVNGFVMPGGRFLGQPQLFGISDLRDRFLNTIGRPKVLTGRMYDPKAPNEAIVDFAAADRIGLRVGSVLRAVVGDPYAGPRRTVRVRIVGIVAHPRVFPAFGASNLVTTIELSPAFAPAHHLVPDPNLATWEIRVRGGGSGVSTFLAEVHHAGLGGFDLPYVQTTRTASVQKSTRIEADTLWALAAVMLLAAGAVLGQALSRQTRLSSREFPTLATLGMSRRQLFVLGLMRAAIVGAAAGLVAVAVAAALSPLTPIGLARVAEPDPGFSFDWIAIGIGAVAVLIVTVVLTAIPAWRAATKPADVMETGSRRSSLAEVATRRVRSPAAGVGVRMALEPGGGRTAVPVRSAVMSATLAVAALIAGLTFWSSLQHLVATPRLSGYVFDLFSAPPSDNEGHTRPADIAQIASVLRRDRNIAAFARGGVINLRIHGQAVFAFLSPSTGPLAPVVVAGRAPRAANEIALGRLTMQRAGVGIGDTLSVGAELGISQEPPPRMVRVVGEVITPTSLIGEANPGEGAAVIPPTAFWLAGSALTQEMVDGLPFLIRFRDGVDRQAEVDRLLDALPDGTYSVPAEHRGDISTLGRISSVPLALAVLLGMLALGTLAQTLVTSVRARRRDLAVLKTLGFSRRQLRGTVAWQASTLAAVSLAIGIPIGLLAGRWIWRAFAGGIAVVPAPVVGPTAVVIAVAITIALANLVAAIPSRTAARTKAAVVLRSE